MTISSIIAALQQQLEERTAQLQKASQELQEMLEEIEILQEERSLQREELITVRKTAESERQRYQDLFEFAPDGYLLTDAKGIIQEANFAATSLLCTRQQHLIGRSLLLFFTEQDRKAFDTRLMKLRQVQNWEVHLQPQEGLPLPVSVTIAPGYNLQGKMVWRRWLIQDISDRKQAEKSIQFQANVLSQVNDAVIAIDHQQRITYWNPGAERLYNLKADEVLGQPLETAYQMRWLEPQQKQAICDSVTQTGSWRGETIHLKKSGEEIYVESSLSVLKDDKGVAIGFLAVNRDITDRKQAEQIIYEQAALLNITTDAIIVRDLQDKIVFWNNGAERLYGWQQAEALGKNANQLLYKNLKTSPPKLKIQQTLAKNGSWQGELQHVTKNGKVILVESRWTLVRDEQKQPKSILIVNTDITEKKQLEMQLLRAQRLESLGTLASGIAHDLNNILTPILAVAQLLPRKLTNLEQRNQQLLKILEDNSKRGADLVKQILSFARGAEGKRTIVQVGYVLKEDALIANKTFPKSIKIHIETVSPNLWTVLADTTQLHQVILNLCVNARDAMPKGGVLSLAAENIFVDENFTRMHLDAQTGPHVVIKVSDTGTGIPPEVLERIFDPFFTTKEPGKGTGLGLAMVIGIVKNHKGFLTVESEVGKGTQFQVYFPATRDEETPLSEDLAVPKGSGELILIVDDEISIQRTSKASLEDHHYKTIIANDGKQAIALYTQYQSQISIVLMDIIMPSMDGLAVIRSLQKMNPQIKIIATSGIVSNTRITEATGTGVKAFLSKPFTIQELLSTVYRVLKMPVSGSN